MKTNVQFITWAVAQRINRKQLQLEAATTLPHNSIDFFKKQTNKAQSIYIYDLGFNNTQTTIPVNDHINKTGSNPLCGHNKEGIVFYDITNIYQQQQGAQTAECFGSNAPDQANKAYIQTRFLCHHTIAAHCAGFKKIFAYIID